MRISYLYFILCLTIVSCKTDHFLATNPKYSKILIDTLLHEKMSCRALTIDNDKVWFSANNGKYGFITWQDKSNFFGNISKENLKLEFRSIAQTSKSVFILSVANPALLYKIDKATKAISLVYEEHHESVFYDAMIFINDLEGFAVGDPINNTLSFLKTTDGGNSWQKVTSENLPKLNDGEAFFAASNTNINCKNGTLFLVSGGKSSRVFVSKDKGNSWQIYDTPIIQGQSMSGSFTSDFYDDKYGIIAGGNYEKLLDNSQNKAITYDGGKTWVLVSNQQAFGYASCVQYLPGSKGKSLLEVGADGVFYSRNRGKRWRKLSNDQDFITFRFIDHKTLIASGKNRIVKIELQ